MLAIVGSQPCLSLFEGLAHDSLAVVGPLAGLDVKCCLKEDVLAVHKVIQAVGVDNIVAVNG